MSLLIFSNKQILRFGKYYYLHHYVLVIPSHQCSSSFASDEIYIAVDKLVEISLLDSKDLHHFNVDTGIIEYHAVEFTKTSI